MSYHLYNNIEFIDSNTCYENNELNLIEIIKNSLTRFFGLLSKEFFKT